MWKSWRARVVLGAPLALFLSWAPVARAGELEAAEAARLSEEMRTLAARNAWVGVEGDFRQLLVLERKGQSISPQDWVMGAQSARGVGNMTACRERLAKSVALSPSGENINWLSQIDGTFGAVDLSADKTLLPRPKLAAKVMPFIPDQRQAIEFARAAVEETMDFKGLVPAGEYTYGGETLQVVAGGEVVAVHLQASVIQRSGDEPFKFAFLGPRIEIGGAFTQGGEVADGVDAPPSFGGMGIRSGLGLEAGLNPRLGVFAMVGYHGLTAKVDNGNTEAIEGTENFSGHWLRLGFLSLGASYRLGGLRIAGGPVVGMGVAQAMNEEESAQDLLWVTKGPMAAIGGGVSAGYAVLPLGTSLELLVSLSGGAQHDSQRLYPWGQAAIVVAPSTPSSE